MKESLFNDRKLIHEKFLRFGFIQTDYGYFWQTDLKICQMKLEVKVTNNLVFTRVLDPEFDEEYTLHCDVEQNGTFVSNVRYEYLEWMHKILEACTIFDSFKSPDAMFIKEHLHDIYGDELEYLWKTTDAAAVRCADTRKWYACFMHVSRRKLGFDSDEVIEIVDLHTKKEKMSKLLEDKNILPGYHMNKNYWFTVCLDGSISHSYLLELINFSYELARSKN